MNALQSLSSVILLGAVALTPATVRAQGRVSGTITKLEGQPRAGLPFTYQVFGRQLNSNNRYIIKNRTTTSTTQSTREDAGGRFSIGIPASEFRPGTKEVFVLLESDGKQPVELSYLLGTAQHEVAIVMRDLFYKVLELPMVALRAPNGSFHLAGLTGTALFRDPATRKLRLQALSYQRQDENFTYYDDDGIQKTHWAYSIHPHTRYVCRGSCWWRCERFRIWIFDDQNDRWLVFGSATRFLPADVSARGTVVGQIESPEG